jgi:NitT/TauT family transport system substrate-binding protein
MTKQLAVLVMASLVFAGCGGGKSKSTNKPKTAKKQKGKGKGKPGAKPKPGQPGGEGGPTLEAADKNDPATFLAYTFDAKKLKPVTGAAGYKALGKPRVVRLGISTWPGWAPLVLANEGTKPKLVWKDAKGGEFQVELVVVDDSVKLTDQLAAGDLHGGWASVDMLPLLTARLMRDPRALPRIHQQIDWSNGGDAIVARDPAKTVADLKGKTIVLAQSSPAQYLLFNALLDAGLQPSDVQPQFVRDPFLALAAYNSDKKLTAVATAAPMMYDVTRPGMPGKAVLATGTDNELIARVFFTRADFARDHMAIVEALVRGMLDAAQGLNSDEKRAQVAKMLDQAFKLPAGASASTLTDAHWARFADNKRFFMDRNNPARFERTYAHAVQLFQALKVIDQAPAFDQLVDVSILRKLDKEPRYSTQTSSYEVHHVPVVGLREEKGVIVKTYRVAFAPGSVDVGQKIGERLYDPDADATLETVGRIAALNKSFIVRLTGYADNSLKGKVDEAQVRELSQSRAYAVREVLSKYKIDPERFAPTGAGWDKPADPDDPNNHVKNRRVEIEVVPPGTN